MFALYFPPLTASSSVLSISNTSSTVHISFPVLVHKYIRFSFHFNFFSLFLLDTVHTFIVFRFSTYNMADITFYCHLPPRALSPFPFSHCFLKGKVSRDKKKFCAFKFESVLNPLQGPFSGDFEDGNTNWKPPMTSLFSPLYLAGQWEAGKNDQYWLMTEENIVKRISELVHIRT